VFIKCSILTAFVPAGFNTVRPGEHLRHQASYAVLLEESWSRNRLMNSNIAFTCRQRESADRQGQ